MSKMNTNTTGVGYLFQLLESNKVGEVEEIKKVFHDLFSCTKDNWLVNGLFDYYLSTNSLRAIEVLAGVREPHDKHLLDRLDEALPKPGRCSQRMQALTLLGHIARRQPTWLYKLANHTLFKDLLKLLKVEADTLSLMSALLLLVMLLPMLPAALGPYLQEIFEVFGRLASYYHQQSSSRSSCVHLTSVITPNAIDKDHLYLLHLQVGLCSLFHRLYAMYPCNFISYLKQQYIQKDQMDTFTHTIRPMLDSVRMHPLLVTASKDAEISATRWKKMEHHDVMAECGRFTLDRCREEVFSAINSRCTPPLDQSSSCKPINIGDGITTTHITNEEEDTFWSPSMTVPSHSPPFQPSSHEPRSTPSTPNNNRSGTSPPEAAVEATPETTPVKDLRKLSTRQASMGSTAVRALTSLGNGTGSTTSRPSTPTRLHSSTTGQANSDTGITTHGLFSHKVSKLIMDRQNVHQFSQKSSINNDENSKSLELDVNQNGKNDLWPEDQEILEIVSAHNNDRAETPKNPEQGIELCNNEKLHVVTTNLTHKVYQFPSYLQSLPSFLNSNVKRSKSCSDIKIHKNNNYDIGRQQSLIEIKKLQESATQTYDSLPYEHLLLGILDQRGQEHKYSQQTADYRLSPTTMLDQYVEACTHAKTNFAKQRQKKKGTEDDAEDESTEDNGFDADCTNQLLQLMQMQLQFERQRREVHAERNRRLLGKLRDSRALEQHNYALTDRLRKAESEIDGLKIGFECSKRESRKTEEQYKEALHHWQAKCVEEERQNQILTNRAESLELELKSEQKKVSESDQQIRAAEAALFDAGHQLKGALKAANHGKELERILEFMQKKFLLLGEAQSKLQESTVGLSPIIRQDAAQIQRSYTEELTSLRRQLEARASLVEALKVRLVELEGKEAKKEAQLVDLQRFLQETKDRHEAEVQAVDSKYKAQVEINLLLEGRILELLGTLDSAAASMNTTTNNVATSASPKERSPPLSVSLASSSEGSLAFIHSSTGIIMNDCCDAGGEIPNLQAIVEPIHSNQTTSPSRLNQRRPPKQD